MKNKDVNDNDTGDDVNKDNDNNENIASLYASGDRDAALQAVRNQAIKAAHDGIFGSKDDAGKDKDED